MPTPSRLPEPLLALVPLVVAAAYFNALGGSFQFDDYNVIVFNPAVESFAAWWRSMPGMRPLLKLSWVLNGGSHGAAWSFIAVNIALHALNALLVCALLRELGLPTRSALLAALLFAAHPVNTEAVSYVSGRSVSLMASFYLSALWLHLRGRRLAAAAGFVAALACKETALTWPFAALLLDHWRAPGRSPRELLEPLAHYLFVMLATLLTLLALPRYVELLEASLAARAPLDNLVTQSAALPWLALRLLHLHGLNADPDLPVFVEWSGFWAATTLLCLMPLLFAVRLWSRRPALATGLLWFFLHLAPTNSLLARLDIANERQLYLAALPVFVGLAAWLAARRAGAWRTAAAAALIVGLAGATHQRNTVYADEVAFWRDVTARSPAKARGWNNLGHALAAAGRPQEALAAYDEALALDPRFYRAHFNRLELCAVQPAICMSHGLTSPAER